MRNLQFGFFDDSGLPRESRILMFYSFDTEENLSRSGILHYHVAEQRFVGPRHDGERTDLFSRRAPASAVIGFPFSAATADARRRIHQ